MYKLFTIKRYIEQILMWPFILIGKCIALAKPLKEDFDIFFFFPGYAIGGAERVNAEIIKAFSDKKVIIYFTKNSPNNGMKHFFNLPNVTIREINKWADNKYIFWGNLIYRGICSQYINSQSLSPIVFIGQCNFAYKLTPHIKRNIKIHELIHMFDSRFTWVWAPFVKFINTRIIVGEIFRVKFGESYLQERIPIKYLDRLRIIFYRLEFLPNKRQNRSWNLPLKVYYAGRGGPQKRVWIIVKVIQKCREMNLPISFKLAGSFKNEMPQEFIDNGIYIGELKGGEEMYNFHKQNDVLLMTSAWEGFPLVIMEAMSFGAIPLVTNIDAIPEHIINAQNGFLLNNISDENLLVNEIIENLLHLIEHHKNLDIISLNAYQYSLSNFSAEKFQKEYRNVLLEN